MALPNEKVAQQLAIAAKRRAQGRSTPVDEAALNYAEKRYGFKAPPAPTTEDLLGKSQAELNTALERQNQLSNAGFGLRSALQQALSQRSPEFSLDQSALEARYGNPQSPLYIDNPFVRDAVIQRAMSGQQQAFSTIADRLQNLLGLQTAQQGQLVQGLQGKVSGYQDQLSATAKAQQQQFENELALQRLAISKLSANRQSTPTPPSLGFYGVYDANGKQVGVANRNPKTGQLEFMNAAGTMSIQFPEGGTIRGLGYQQITEGGDITSSYFPD